MTRNKEQLNEWNRKYYEKRKNEPVYKEKRRISAKKYYQTHRKKCIKARLDYFLKNKEKYRKYRREWRYLTPAGIYMTIKGSVKHRKNNYLLSITREDFIEWYKKQEKKCFYCGRTLEVCQADKLNLKSKRLTIDRIDNSKGYEEGNIVLACLRCNSIKSDYFTKDEMLEIGGIIRAKRT